MRYLLIALLLSAGLAHADKLIITPPTQYVNGEALSAADIEKYTFYREGELHREVPPTQLVTEIPAVCNDVRWTVTATAKNGKTSALSAVALQHGTPSACPAPKAPSLRVTIEAQ